MHVLPPSRPSWARILQKQVPLFTQVALRLAVIARLGPRFRLLL